MPVSDKPEPPKAGHQVVKAKACCPGFLHRAAEEGKRPSSLNEDTIEEVKRLLKDEWIAARAQEHIVEAP